MTYENGRVTLTNIDEETIQRHGIRFRWWRRHGNNPWEVLDVPESQQWVIVELDQNQQVSYRVEILLDGESYTNREHTFSPTNPSFMLDMTIPILLATLTAFLAFLILVIIIVVRMKRARAVKPNKT